MASGQIETVYLVYRIGDYSSVVRAFVSEAEALDFAQVEECLPGAHGDSFVVDSVPLHWPCECDTCTDAPWQRP